MKTLPTSLDRSLKILVAFSISQIGAVVKGEFFAGQKTRNSGIGWCIIHLQMIKYRRIMYLSLISDNPPKSQPPFRPASPKLHQNQNFSTNNVQNFRSKKFAEQIPKNHLQNRRFFGILINRNFAGRMRQQNAFNDSQYGAARDGRVPGVGRDGSDAGDAVV